MPATLEATKITDAEASSGREEDFSAVIRAMEQMAEANAMSPEATFQLNAERRC
jgi:hypothetical protein